MIPCYYYIVVNLFLIIFFNKYDINWFIILLILTTWAIRIKWIFFCWIVIIIYVLHRYTIVIFNGVFDIFSSVLKFTWNDIWVKTQRMATLNQFIFKQLFWFTFSMSNPYSKNRIFHSSKENWIRFLYFDSTPTWFESTWVIRTKFYSGWWCAVIYNIKLLVYLNLHNITSNIFKSNLNPMKNIKTVL